MKIKLEIKRLPHGEELPFPSYASDGAAGMDVVSAEDIILQPMQRYPVKTGFTVAIPKGYEIQVRARSGLALKHGIACPNAPGTIDSDYRGEIKILLVNLGVEAFAIKRGDRIAQLILAPVTQAEFCEVAELDSTERGHNGFGSTGI
ncbi:MAG: dUTP diphosphatase [Zymomonas mobilis]|uniref:Deoxyuridine 5'-triphosphate nucleotidohydrolase n=1 Tax=Zymomonas mobilis TaxID=542 RepID=A0A542W1U5_ZYMMB|nr:dUTP diphosphatase [Zymomonas mobilis]TQL17565.1 deoxyuridine 5'-triphosphate nucleotidohydrolase [Zymomonas mobilis]